MRIYISIPMRGHDMDEVEARITFAESVIERKGHDAVNPLLICSTDDSYEAHIGADITVLLRSDAVVMMEGWKDSRGCRLERNAAKIYGIPVYGSLDAIPENPALWHLLGEKGGEA